MSYNMQFVNLEKKFTVEGLQEVESVDEANVKG